MRNKIFFVIFLIVTISSYSRAKYFTTVKQKKYYWSNDTLKSKIVSIKYPGFWDITEWYN